MWKMRRLIYFSILVLPYFDQGADPLYLVLEYLIFFRVRNIYYIPNSHDEMCNN